MNILRSARIIAITLIVHLFHQYRFENSKGVIKTRISKKNRQYNGQKKKIQMDKQRSTKHTHKTTDRETRTSQKKLGL